MMPVSIDTANSRALDSIPEKCGAVTVGCTDVAGIVDKVIRSSEILRAEHEALRGTVKALEADQNKVSEASDEARLLSERAIERLGEGTALIQSSLGQIGSLLELVDALGQHVTGFSAAMEQVRRSAKDIEDIAETTNATLNTSIGSSPSRRISAAFIDSPLPACAPANTPKTPKPIIQRLLIQAAWEKLRRVLSLSAKKPRSIMTGSCIG